VWGETVFCQAIDAICRRGNRATRVNFENRVRAIDDIRACMRGEEPQRTDRCASPTKVETHPTRSTKNRRSWATRLRSSCSTLCD
jgi:hypothetical protein